MSVKPPTVRPPELGLALTALVQGGVIANGILRYALFGSALLLVVIFFFEVLPAVLALMASGSAAVGLFGVNPEGLLAFVGLGLAGMAALASAGAAVFGCAALLRYLWQNRDRIPRRLSGRGGGRPSIRSALRPNHPAPGDSRYMRSLSQHIVSLAVRRLPAGMCEEERERWEEEMRSDVESMFFLLRTIHALSIWRRGARVMPDGMDAQDKPTPGR